MAKQRCEDDPVPADPYVCEAFRDVMLARRARRRPGSKATADKLEREAWKCLLHYLLTLECLPLAHDDDN